MAANKKHLPIFKEEDFDNTLFWQTVTKENLQADALELLKCVNYSLKISSDSVQYIEGNDWRILLTNPKIKNIFLASLRFESQKKRMSKIDGTDSYPTNLTINNDDYFLGLDFKIQTGNIVYQERLSAPPLLQLKLSSAHMALRILAGIAAVAVGIMAIYLAFTLIGLTVAATACVATTGLATALTGCSLFKPMMTAWNSDDTSPKQDTPAPTV